MPTDRDLREGIDYLEQGRHSLALEHVTVAADHAKDPDERRAAVAFAAQISLTLGRPYEAVAWAEQLRDGAGNAVEADVLEAAAWVALSDGSQALSLLDGLSGLSTPYTTYSPGLVHQLRAQAHQLLGDVDQAVEEARAALSDDWAQPEAWRVLAQLAAVGEVDVRGAVDPVPDEGVLQVLGWVADAPTVGADVIAEVLWHRRPGDPQVLAFVTVLGNRLSLERAVEWSVRLRAAGLADECALLGVAANEQRDPVERVRAAALTATTFDDARAVPLVELAATAVADDDVVPVLSELLSLGCDEVVDAFVVAVATTAPRTLALAGKLVELGAAAPAIALARHAAELTTGQPDALRRAVASALPRPAMDALVAALLTADQPEVAALLAA